MTNTTATAASPTALDAFRFEEARRAALQDGVNYHADHIGDVERTAYLIRQLATEEHAEYPQYAGHWDGDDWKLGQIHGDVRTKGGLRFADGDWVLYKVRHGLVGCATEVTAYSVRGEINCSVGGAIRWWEAA